MTLETHDDPAVQNRLCQTEVNDVHGSAAISSNPANLNPTSYHSRQNTIFKVETAIGGYLIHASNIFITELFGMNDQAPAGAAA